MKMLILINIRVVDQLECLLPNSKSNGDENDHKMCSRTNCKTAIIEYEWLLFICGPYFVCALFLFFVWSKVVHLLVCHFAWLAFSWPEFSERIQCGAQLYSSVLFFFFQLLFGA